MTLIQHTSVPVRFEQQVQNAKNYLIPFLTEAVPLKPGIKIMEIGCGEGGVLKPFLEQGISCVGVDLSVSRIANARKFLAAECTVGLASFFAENVYSKNFLQKHKESYDLIILKDTIEHIPEQEKFIPYITQFLTPEGKIFFGFPPWYMPYGGHQQTCRSFLSNVPYFHLLPKPLYKGALKVFKESEASIKSLLEIKETGISIERFERIIHQSKLEIFREQQFLFNPIYYYKFGWKPRVQFPLINKIPFVRNFLTTASWYLVGRN